MVLNICYERDNVVRLVSAGGVPPLIAFAKDDSHEDLQANAAGAVQSICFQKEGRTFVRELGAIEAVLPLRERPIKAWLRSHDAGEVVVRTRGGAIEVDRWTRLLRGDGANPFVVFGLRLGMTTRAIVTQPAG